MWSRDSSVGVAAISGLDGRGSIPEKEQYSVRTGSGAHQAIYPLGLADSFPGVERLGREAHHSPPSGAEVRNAGAVRPLLQYAWRGGYLIQHRLNFTFTFPRMFTVY
jgi:hypothetical protein